MRWSILLGTAGGNGGNMEAFRDEMQCLAERRSHVEGRLDERGSAAG